MDQQGIIQRKDKRFRRCICARLCPSQLAVNASVSSMTYNASRIWFNFASRTPCLTFDMLWQLLMELLRCCGWGGAGVPRRVHESAG
jgi:hypothetical protein